MSLRLATRTVGLCLLATAFGPVVHADDPGGLSPEAALRSIRVEPGFTVELAASEPLVKDPIAIDWGADGRLWVVEMGDYPLGIDGKGKPGGQVRVLEDRDGNGRYDSATVFLDGLAFPTGVMPWRKGVIVACAPEIFYAEDRDGDGKADAREVLYSGFVEGNQQHRVNGFEYGLDGWIHGANGDSGGTVRSSKTGESTPINGRDFRFRPDTGAFETESGQTQFGRHRDDWGHWFGNNNPNWAWHFVLKEADLRRNPHFAPPDPKHMLEPDTRLYPASKTVPRFNEPWTANHATSANSPTPYRDDLFGPEFVHSLFVSEPVHNLVHRIVLEPDGATFKGRRGPGESGREFLASSDPWFRPTMLKTGPDGALWVADMYRAVIEHPEWIPDDWERRLDLRAGGDQGRIYRVRPAGKAPRPIPRLDRLDLQGLVAALDSPNGWQRDTAQRLLMERADPASVPALRTLAAKTSRAEARLQALWTLAGLEGLDEATALGLLGDGHPEVRRGAVEATRPMLGRSPRVADAVRGLAEDADARVRLQVALAMGDWADPRGGETLVALARREDNDAWMRAAVLSSAVPHAAMLVAELCGKGGEKTDLELVGPLVTLAASTLGRDAVDALARAASTPSRPDGRFGRWQYAVLTQLLDVRNRVPDPERDRAMDRASEPLREAARATVRDEAAELSGRILAVRLLARQAASADDLDLLVGLLRPQLPVPLQQETVAALTRGADRRVPSLLLESWKRDSPQVRGAILGALLAREPWTGDLLSALEDGRVAPSDLDPASRQRLVAHRDGRIRSRAAALLARPDSSRHRVLEAYRPALTLAGKAEAGSTLFKNRCAACHRFGGSGSDVGPDLAALTDKSPEALLTAILDPNRALEAKYAGFTVATVDGRVLSGLIAAETANAVTLRLQEGKEEVLLRSQIEAMDGSGRSLMPEGLEDGLSPQDLADLIVFLASSESPPPAK